MAKRIFADPDELASLVRASDAEICVKGPAAGPSWISVVNIGDLELQLVSLSPALTSVHTLHQGLVQVSIPLTNQPGWMLDGRSLGRRNLLVVGPGEEHVVSTAGPVRFLSIHIPHRKFLERSIALSGGCNYAGASYGLYTPPVPAVNAIQHMAGAVYRFARYYPQLAAKPSANNVVLGPFLDALVRIGRPDADTVVQTRHDAHRITHILQEFIHSHPDEIIPLSDLCQVTGSSARAIHDVFHKLYGTSPARYLRLRRLNQAYRALRKADRAQTNVTDIAIQYGFFDVGRFAAQYQKIFGQFPSQTLRDGKYPDPSSRHLHSQ